MVRDSRRGEKPESGVQRSAQSLVRSRSFAMPARMNARYAAQLEGDPKQCSVGGSDGLVASVSVVHDADDAPVQGVACRAPSIIFARAASHASTDRWQSVDDCLVCTHEKQTKGAGGAGVVGDTPGDASDAARAVGACDAEEVELACVSPPLDRQPRPPMSAGASTTQVRIIVAEVSHVARVAPRIATAIALSGVAMPYFAPSRTITPFRASTSV